MFDFDSIVHTKRYLGDSFCGEKAEYDNSVVDYDFDYIVPGDKILRIVAFDWVPVQFRTVRLGISIGPEGGTEQKKRIDFDFRRNEYRKKGNHFREPKKADQTGGAD